MKTRHQAARGAAYTLAAVLVTALPAAAAPGNGNGNGNKKIPTVPSGWLTAFPTMVQTGTHPTLTWSISYPSVVKDFIDIIGPGTIKVKEEVDCEIRVLGNGVTAHNSSTGQFISWVNAEARVSYNGGSYNQIFYGTNLDVNPNAKVWTQKKIKKNETLRFGGRYYYGGWGPFRHSEGGTLNVRTLVHGDTPPTTEPMHLAPSLEEFIEPYLDGAGQVNIGPMDVIVFMELTHSDNQQDNQGYDLQDMVLLVTFKADKPKNNNGHGNNIDGVDMSNPGNAPFMQYDTDPTVDDEGGGGGAYPSQ